MEDPDEAFCFFPRGYLNLFLINLHRLNAQPKYERDQFCLSYCHWTNFFFDVFSSINISFVWR